MKETAEAEFRRWIGWGVTTYKQAVMLDSVFNE